VKTDKLRLALLFFMNLFLIVLVGAGVLFFALWFSMAGG
jgi:hypothetical protein